METWDIGIQTTAPNQTFSVNIVFSASPNITIDWGDGTVETFTTAGVKTRTYASASFYTIKISGSFGGLKLGSTSAEKARVQSTSIIPNIPGLTYLQETFAGCFNLQEIPANLFINNLNINQFDSCFAGTSITNIPTGLFDQQLSAYTCEGCFAGCTSLVSVPDGLFDDIISTTSEGYTNFIDCFRFCTSLSIIPANLFEKNVSGFFVGVFDFTPISTTSYSNLLINLASNASERLNDIPFGANSSFYNIDAETAKQTLEAKGWQFNDLGLEVVSTTWDIDIQITSPNQTFGIQLFAGTDPNITVDWGDEDIQIFTTLGPKIKTYNTPGYYTIKISGSFGSNGNIRLGTTTDERARIQSTSIIPTIPGLDNFNLSFREANSLTNIPENLFVNNPQVTSFFATFASCENLQSIPENLFANNPLVTDVSSCFAGCSSITDIPSNLFAYNPAITNFFICFSIPGGNITSIPENLFANNPLATNFEGCFSATSITIIPENLFINNPLATNFEGCFASTNITIIPENLFANNLLATNFHGCFQSCQFLENVPANVFANNIQVTDFSYLFAECYSFTTVPDTLFFNNTGVIDFDACFEFITLTTSSYSNLLINMASNAANRQNNVFFGGGNSRYNLAGQTARQTLQNKGWAFTDLGLESSSSSSSSSSLEPNWIKILNVGNNICESSSFNCFKILNVGRNICNPGDTNCLKINDVRRSEPTTWDIGIQIDLNLNPTFSINIFAGTNPNITVDWGDGTVETFTTIGVKTKTYASAGSYTVKISGSFASGGNIRLGSTNIEKSIVQSTSVIPTIPGLDNFNQSFQGCLELTSIPSNLFVNNPNVTSFLGCFSGCGSLTSIPTNLFANNTAVTNFSFCFSSCNSLTSIPENLFANNTAVTNFDQCFAQCISLISIPSLLFFNNINVQRFVNCFVSCESLTSVPADLFANNIAVTTFFGVFSSCTSLTSIPANLFANNIAVTTFAFAFLNVILTTTSYSNLLINIASNAASRNNNVPFGGGNSSYNLAGQTAKQTLEAKGWTFTDGGLDSTVPATWDVGIQTTGPNNTFTITIFDNGDSGNTQPNITIDWGDGSSPILVERTSIGETNTYLLPGNYTIKISGSLGADGNIQLGSTLAESARVKSTSIIPNIPGLNYFSRTFQDCSSLTEIPNGLFNNNNIFSFNFCFSNCTGLTSIPATLFANNISAIEFLNCFENVSLTTTSYSNLLINIASNAASRNNNVPFGGGNSKYNLGGQTARQTLQAKNWTFTDGGLES
jgi:hypothetical protein